MNQKVVTVIVVIVREAVPHPTVGMLVLLLIQVLNMYKPRALTPYGWRKQHEQRQTLQRSRQERAA